MHAEPLIPEIPNPNHPNLSGNRVLYGLRVDGLNDTAIRLIEDVQSRHHFIGTILKVIDEQFCMVVIESLSKKDACGIRCTGKKVHSLNAVLVLKLVQ